MKEIYLDNCATTKPREEVIEEMMNVLRYDYGNPSSLHRKGFNSEKLVESSRKKIADYLKVNTDEIYFTSGGTESNNIAIQSIINNNHRNGKHIITTSIEHPSIGNIMKYYSGKNYEISYLNVDENGFIDLDEFEKILREDTILVSIILVNNEIGTIQKIARIRDILNRNNSKAFLHLDGIQAIGKIDIDLNLWKVDSLSLSAHKIYGPKGIGALYIREGIKTSPIVFGGNQEKGLRSGTENVPGIVGLGKAIEIINNNYEKESKYIYSLKEYLMDNIIKEIDDIKINSLKNIDDCSPYIVNISFNNIRSEILLHFLEDKGIYISSGSACSKGTTKSETLMAIGLNNKLIDGSIRICLSHDITFEDIDTFIFETKKAVNEIRQISMR